MDNKNKITYENLFNFSSLSVHRNAIYGFSALWIVLFHGVDMGKASFPPQLRFLWDTFQLGNIGVDIFLFLSGVGLYYSFSKDSRVLRFYYKRFIRVLLPFILLCVPYITYLLIAGEIGFGEFLQHLTNISYWTANTGRLNLWYIPAILVLYLLYPLIYKFIFGKGENALLRCVILTAASIAVTMIIYLISPELYRTYNKFLPRVAVFILGCWCGQPVKEKKEIPAWFMLAGIVIVLAAYPLYSRSIIPGPLRRYYGSLTGIMLTFLLAQFFELFKSLRLGEFFAFFGGFSLESYLIHIEARNWYMHSPYYGGHIWKEYAVLAVGSIILAYLVSMIEKPIVKQLMKPMNKDRS